MAPPQLTDRAAPAVVTNGTPPYRASRLPPRLRVPILVVLNLGINTALWSFVTNFLDPELGAVSKVPGESASELFSLYSPIARLAFKVLTVWLTWKLQYDYIDVAALTVITHAPYAYLLVTYYEISTLTAAALIHIELLSIAVPIFLLRAPSAVHNPDAPVRNRFLLNSFQVNASTVLLSVGVYVTVLWAALRTGLLNQFLVSHFDIPTLEAAHAETPVSIIWKTFVAGLAAKAFLLNPSIAAQPASGAVTPVHEFEPATATLPETVKHNVWFFSRRTRTLIQQTAILNVFLFANTVQRSMTINGTDFVGSAGYAGLWILGNVICAGWWAWVGDTES